MVNTRKHDRCKNLSFNGSHDLMISFGKKPIRAMNVIHTNADTIKTSLIDNSVYLLLTPTNAYQLKPR